MWYIGITWFFFENGWYNWKLMRYGDIIGYHLDKIDDLLPRRHWSDSQTFQAIYFGMCLSIDMNAYVDINCKQEKK